jgi:hypothetical protein
MSSKSTAGLAIVIGLFLVPYFATSAVALDKTGSYSLYYAWHAAGDMTVLDEDNSITASIAHGVLINQDGSGFLHQVPTDCAGGGAAGVDVGSCVSKDADGDLVYMRWTCTWDAEGWCIGTFDWVSGTGKYEGISGQSDIRYVVSGFRTGTPNPHATPWAGEGYSHWDGGWKLP